MSRQPALRYSGRLRRCRNCGIRVRREEMVYNFLACSDDCADDLWIRTSDQRSEEYDSVEPEPIACRE